MNDLSENEQYERDLAIFLEQQSKKAKELGLSVDDYVKLQEEYNHLVCDGWYVDRTQGQWIEDYVRESKRKNLTTQPKRITL